MHPNHRTIRRGPLTAVAALLLASLLLAACGSSSSTTTSNAAARTATTGSGRFTALRDCLAKAGITLPRRTGTPGTGRPPGAGPGFGGGRTLPKGVTREQFEKALAKCGGGFARGSFAGARLNGPAYRAALAKFAACMSEDGVKLPAPNTTGNGPVFNTKGLNANTPKFIAARRKCSPLLRFGPGADRPPGTPGTPGAAGPPTAGTTPPA